MPSENEPAAACFRGRSVAHIAENLSGIPPDFSLLCVPESANLMNDLLTVFCVSKMGRGGTEMTETFTGRKESYIIVTDENGEEYVCPKSTLKKKSELTKEELKNCIPEAVTGGGASVGG
jgi:hypothetical protein